ncbi:hypothetical protein [Clostridium chromiireducens]|uniref:Uncharacterized protein n=1 Tax=Clostridium chromiireducens TaxID=225345 RepID=A0A1V4I5P6_9CLOT|nr:hypothetical protein [Clostridium chromiireducens]OPJ55204.1 hypothetical protein CLCHR_47090 [Clostridium chromiireducens]
MNSFENIEAYSWNHKRIEYASKIIDDSLIKYCETVIPIEIRIFFGIESCKPGDKVNIIILHNCQEYTGRIYFENNFNRSKLKLDKRFIDIIVEKIKKLNEVDGKIKLRFIKEKVNKYSTKIIVEV